MSKLNVVLLSPSLGRGGAEEWMISLAKWVPANFYTIITNAKSIKSNMLQKMRQYSDVVSYTDDDYCKISSIIANSDVVVCWGIDDINRYIKNKNIPIIWVAHGTCKLTKAIADIARPNVHVFAGVSEKTRSIFLDSDIVTVIHNGVEIERCTPIKGREFYRKKWDLKDDDKAVGYLGRLSDEKRPLAVVEAINALPLNYKAILIGDGKDELAIKSKALQLCDKSRVKFDGYHYHVGDALAALDVWVNASPAEGFSLSLIEAWIASVPVVSTPTGSILELEQEYGKLVSMVPIGCNGCQLARAIKEALSDDFKPIVEKARLLAWNKLTAASMSNRWSEFIQVVVDNHRMTTSV